MFCLLYLLVHNPGPKLLIFDYKNQSNSEIYNLKTSEDDPTLPHPTCILLFSQNFSHKVACFTYEREQDNDILFVAKQV